MQTSASYWRSRHVLSPAIVTKAATRRLPRWAIWLLCCAYVIPGFVGRSPWKSADVLALGQMREWAANPTWQVWSNAGATDSFALLPYWLGALSIRLFDAIGVGLGIGFDPALAARLPFIAMLGMTLSLCWYACYSLARSPAAQPVSFAFGGEASGRDYARAIADGALLALMACLGLAMLTHEATATLAQLCMCSAMFYGAAHWVRAGLGWASGVADADAAIGRHSLRQLLASAFIYTLGLFGLVLSGAPSVALLLHLAVVVVAVIEYRAIRRGVALHLLKQGISDWGLDLVSAASARAGQAIKEKAVRHRVAIGLAALAVVLFGLAVWLSYALNLWVWRIAPQWHSAASLGDATELLSWFTWPVWPMALWALWRWRMHRLRAHVTLPLVFVSITCASALSTHTADRSLLLALPAFAVLAAFALPTFKRSVAAFIDWFTLVFFCAAVLCIWVVWLALMTGFPAQPAVNVQRLAPEFVAQFSFISFGMAALATLAWLSLVKWRMGYHRPALWTTLVLPASGAVLCWVLLMTLWLPMLNHARSYENLSKKIAPLIHQAQCVNTAGLSTAQQAGLRYHFDVQGLKNLRFDAEAFGSRCDFWLLDSQQSDKVFSPSQQLTLQQWTRTHSVKRFADKAETVLVYQRPQRKNAP